MKKLILLALTALMMVGCSNYDDPGRAYFTDGFWVSEIDSCEYLRIANGHGAYFTHKGNCKFCAERRQKELKELVEQLKEK